MKPYDVKLLNGMNITENRLYEAMKNMCLYPFPQYQISEMKVDFAFPNEHLIVEIQGQHHIKPKYLVEDVNRSLVLERLGWKIIYFNASIVYNNPLIVAQKIKKELIKINPARTMENELGLNSFFKK